MRRAHVHFYSLGLMFEGTAHYSKDDGGGVELDGVVIEAIESSEPNRDMAQLNGAVWVSASEMDEAQLDRVYDGIHTYESERRSGAYNYTVDA